MDRRRLYPVIIAVAVIAASVATFFAAPSGSTTTIPIPAPIGSTNSSNGTSANNKGIQIVAENLEVPWAIDIAHDGRIFFTERSGKIRVIDQEGKLLEEPAAYINVEQRGESGLLGLALHPDFDQNHLLYIYQTYSNSTEGKVYNKVLMLTEKNNKIIGSKVIVDKIPAAERNDGGRIKFGPDGKLYIATGDAGNPDLAQNAKSLAGKILRVNPDGSIPPDNPFPDSPVYSYGHRNIQGLAWDPETGELYASEHGSSGNDEINLIKLGGNYGWPIEECPSNGQFEKSIVCFNPSIAPAGMAIPSSDKLGYKDKIILATLKGQHLRLIDLKSNMQENILTGYGRLRDVVEGQDGSLYVLTSNRDGRAIPDQGDDKIVKIISP